MSRVASSRPSYAAPPTARSCTSPTGVRFRRVTSLLALHTLTGRCAARFVRPDALQPGRCLFGRHGHHERVSAADRWHRCLAAAAESRRRKPAGIFTNHGTLSDLEGPMVSAHLPSLSALFARTLARCTVRPECVRLRRKLMTNAGGSGWCESLLSWTSLLSTSTSAEQAVRNSAVTLRLPDPPALGANDTHDPPNSDLKDWPCVAPTNSFIYNGLCAVCSEEKPCLFDIQADVRASTCHFCSASR